MAGKPIRIDKDLLQRVKDDTDNITPKKWASTEYFSGSMGSGWSLSYNESGISTLEIDNILVRDTFRTHIFQKDIIKATNGQLYISDSGVVEKVNQTDSEIYFKDSKSATFNNGDTIVIKDVAEDGSSISKIEFTVTAPLTSPSTPVEGTTAYIYTLSTETVNAGIDMSIVESGMTAVRVSGPAILLNATPGDGTPYIDALQDQIPKVRIGDLSGLNVSGVSGYGLYGENVYLTGDITATSGFIGTTDNGWNISGDTIESSTSNIILDSINEKITLGTTTNNIILNGNGSATIGELSIATDGAVSSTGFSIDADGTADFSGTLSAPDGSFGNVTIDANGKLTLKNITIDNSGITATDGATTPTTLFFLDANSGSLTAKSGDIAGWNFDTDAFFVGTKDTSGYTGAGDFSISSNGSIHAPEFYLDTDGRIHAQGGDIGGWTIKSTQLTGGNITLDSSGSITNGNFTINNDGSINSDTDEFYIDASGNATFKGDVSGATGTFSGGLDIGDGSFTVDTNGDFIAGDASSKIEWSTTNGLNVIGDFTFDHIVPIYYISNKNTQFGLTIVNSPTDNSDDELIITYSVSPANGSTSTLTLSFNLNGASAGTHSIGLTRDQEYSFTYDKYKFTNGVETFTVGTSTAQWEIAIDSNGTFAYPDIDGRTDTLIYKNLTKLDSIVNQIMDSLRRTGSIGDASANTIREIQVDSVDIGDNNTLNLKAGDNITLTEAAGAVTIDAINTTYGTGGGIALSGGNFSVSAGAGLAQTTTGLELKGDIFDSGATYSGLTVGEATNADHADNATNATNATKADEIEVTDKTFSTPTTSHYTIQINGTDGAGIINFKT